MAGYNKMYLIGGLGGFQGADGITGIELQILVGDGGRQWYEAHYLNTKLNRIAGVKTLIPSEPNHPEALIDSCICFLADDFRDCPSFKQVEDELNLNKVEKLDFGFGGKDVPVLWAKLREEARAIFETIIIFEANIERVQ